MDLIKSRLVEEIAEIDLRSEKAIPNKIYEK
jgi:hypothetical protein